MELFFKSDTIKALRKAGVKSPVFGEEDADWRDREIESKYVQPEDFPIIREVVARKGFCEHIENRRILKKLDAVESLKTIKQGQKVKNLEVLAEAIREALLSTPHKWVFMADETYGSLMPYFMSSVRYHPPQRRGEHYAPAYVDAQLNALTRGEGVDKSFHFNKEDLPATVEGLLGTKEAYIETPKLVTDYEAEIEKYRKESPKTGEQYLAHGRGQAVENEDEGSRRWHRGEISLEREGQPSKVVMDDGLGQGKSQGLISMKFWSSKHVREDEDVDDDSEKMIPLPVHPIVRAFDLGTHDYVDCHIANLEEYKYDAAVINKLVLPDTHKELIDLLTGSAIRRMDDIIRGKAVGIIILCSGKPGTGKCHGKGTPILMHDGTVKRVEDIAVGDLLMGDDCSPREVLSLARGRDQMYRVAPFRHGDGFTVNKDHVLVLWPSPVNRHSTALQEVPLCRYLRMSKSWQVRRKLIQTGVDFPPTVTPTIDPYWLGLWLGDGSTNRTGITTMDAEVVECVESYAKELGLRTSVKEYEGNRSKTHSIIGTIRGKYHDNHLLDMMQALGLREGEKFIPQNYLTGSRETRKRILAGVLDSDGHKHRNGGYDFISVRKRFAEQVVFLARSLGYSTAPLSEVKKGIKRIGFVGTYYRTTISAVHDLPMRVAHKITNIPRGQVKNPLVSGFDVVPLGEGDYYGFTLSGNGRYLLGDFTITHNTLTAEVYSEAARRPLYMVQCSQLGTDDEKLEKHLSEVLARATRWRAILLIDEADVYIHERGADIRQNAIVGVFLRLLEYYKGILFLTTNRETVVDDAIVSRVTAHVRYDIPADDDSRRKLWTVLCKQYGVEPTTAFLSEAMRDFPKVSGRDIRQLIRLARIMADHEKKPVSMAMLRRVAKFHDFTELEDEKK